MRAEKLYIIRKNYISYNRVITILINYFQSAEQHSLLNDSQNTQEMMSDNIYHYLINIILYQTS